MPDSIADLARAAGHIVDDDEVDPLAALMLDPDDSPFLRHLDRITTPPPADPETRLRHQADIARLLSEMTVVEMLTCITTFAAAKATLYAEQLGLPDEAKKWAGIADVVDEAADKIEASSDVWPDRDVGGAG